MNQRGRARFLALFLLIILLLTALAGGLLTEKVPVGKVGIRFNKWYGGISNQDFKTGYHLGITGYHDWIFLDSTTHFLLFSNYREDNPDAQQLEIRTLDNNIAHLDVSIPYRIIVGQGWKIYKSGLNQSYRDRVSSTTVGILRVELAKLHVTDLQNTNKRIKASVNTLPLLNQALEKYHVQAESILIKQVSFTQEYEGKLQEKQYIKQVSLLNKVQGNLEAYTQKTDTREKEIVAAELKLAMNWEKRIQEQKSNYQVEISKIKAETIKYEDRIMADANAQRMVMEAEGKLASDKAEALRYNLYSKILNTPGGRTFVAMQAAENMSFDSLEFNANQGIPFILQIDKLVKALGAK